MTNLLEKVLLTGFGIFTILVFLSIVFPFLNTVIDFQVNTAPKFEKYNNFIEEIDDGIHFVLNNTDEVYLSTVSYPEGLNITFNDHKADFEYMIDGQIYQRSINYSSPLVYKNFNNFPSKSYLLNISFQVSLIDIRLIAF